jgi:hypothetical protein
MRWVLIVQLILRAMKTFIRLSQVIAVICMLTGCEGCEEPIFPPETVTISIDTKFLTSFTTDIIDKGSSTELNSPVCQLVQFGSGTYAELGTFDIYLTCCWNPVDGSHGCTEGFISDSEGNLLTLVCNDGDNGVVFTSDFPYDQTYICSEFEFTGGTGRFAGASGRGIMECDVQGASNTMVHHWESVLTLFKE